MKHLLSKTVLEENMFGFALPYAEGDFMFLEVIKVALKCSVCNLRR